MAAYTDNPEANAESFLRDGYYRTGDLGTIQRDGYLKLIGRIKEIINKGGTKISPTDIENVALSLNSVAQAACFRIADDLYGDEIGLAVRAHAETSGLAVVELKRHMRQYLAAFKVPKQIVFVDAIPYNRAGKPMRGQLAQQFADGLL